MENKKEDLWVYDKSKIQDKIDIIDDRIEAINKRLEELEDSETHEEWDEIESLEKESNELNGKLIEYNGFAKLEDNQLYMRYFFIFRSSYNIEYINDYKTAVVANSDYSNLWIMSRAPSINKDELDNILKDLENKMDISKLTFTKLDPKGRYR